MYYIHFPTRSSNEIGLCLPPPRMAALFPPPNLLGPSVALTMGAPRWPMRAGLGPRSFFSMMQGEEMVRGAR